MKIKYFEPGIAGACILIKDEKTALWDTGLHYCAQNCVRLVKENLEGKDLDYIILSHSHYDHMGALSTLRRAFPNAKVVASEYCAYVFTREGARKVIKQMSDEGTNMFADDPAVVPPFDDSGLSVDITVGTGSSLCLGESNWDFYNTPGHTKCSVCMFDKKSSTLITSETPGVLADNGWAYPSILTSFIDAYKAIDLCESLNAKNLYVEHHGLITKEDGFNNASEFYKRVRECGYMQRDMVVNCKKKGLSDEETLDYLTENVRNKYIITEHQPLTAFQLNTAAYIKTVQKEFPELF